MTGNQWINTMWNVNMSIRHSLYPQVGYSTTEEIKIFQIYDILYRLKYDKNYVLQII